MDELIVRSLQARTEPAEEDLLRQWRQESLGNERHYRELARAWRLVGLIEPQPGPVPSLKLDRALLGRIGRPAWLNLAPRWARAGAVALATAAMLALGVGIGTLFSTDGPPSLLAEEFITGPGEMVTTRLNDRTVVRLAPDSRLRVTGGGERREVWLDGHAFFAVAREDGRPFVVRTRAGEAIVLGTRFDVRVEDDRMEVFVVEGRVVHHTGTEEVQVGAMELSRAAQGERPAIAQVTDAEPLLHWLGDFLVFQSTPMREVARELERRFDVTVRVADGALAERTVTAWFSDESLDDILLIVCRAADASCAIRDSAVTIEP